MKKMSLDLYDKLEEAKNKVGNTASQMIADHFHMEQFTMTDTKISGCCFLHNEKTPSMIWDSKQNCFHCFGCGRNYGIFDLLLETEGSYVKAAQKLFSLADMPYTLGNLEHTTEKKDFFKDYKFPKPELNIERGQVNKYAQQRGISTNTLDYMNVKQDKNGNVVFELYDLDDTLVATKYRPSRAIKAGEPKMWWQKYASVCPALYNINRVNNEQPLLITEGYFDALACVEAGFKNVVSIPGGAEDLNWIEFNYDFLENVKTIILWFDNDRAGQGGLEKAISRLGEYRCKVVKPTEEHEQMVYDYYHNIKDSLDIRKTDANNILLSGGKEEVLKLINTAEEIPSKRLKFLMDCDPVNVRDMEKVSTGFDSLDKILYGNLFPCFTIWSGYAGSGKSSIANLSCLLSAADNGYKTFVFSGELDEGQLADWVTMPFAGYNHIIEWKNPNGRNNYTVSRDAVKQIKSFYRQNIILYSDEDGLDTSGETVLKEMENAYRRYGCRMFLIDNLMCLSFTGEDEDSKWETQKKFIIKLMGFTNKYNVSVNLIVHPKKPSAGVTTNTVYDLHGASEIGNLCHRLFWVKRLNDDPEGYNVEIDIIKDRPSQSAGQSCKFFYDKRTRRVYGNTEEQHKQYSWEKHSRITYSKDIYNSLLVNLPDNQGALPF